MTKTLIGHRYLLGERIGAGGMGTVYRALDRLSDELVALKRLQTDFAPSESQVRLRLALANEFQALAGLRHPHIITVSDYGFDHLQPFFTMELVAQPRSILSAGQFLDTAQKIDLLSQLLSALAYVHRRGIIHRDLKPGNVLLAGQTVKVVDFGLATLEGRVEGRAGTIGYLAPELLRGGVASVASDLFAVGVLAYELLAGWHPFAEMPNLAQAILSQEADFAYVEIDPPLIEILQHLLAKDPAERYQDANRVRSDLHRALGRTTSSESTSTRESFLQTAPLVGRDREVATLTQAVELAIQRQGSNWLVGGESGIGKSRLLQETRTQALVKGMVVLRGQAVSDGGASYQLWRESLRHLVLLAPVEDLEAAVLHPLIPDLEKLLQRSIPSAPLLEPKAAQTRLLTTVAELVGRTASQQPLLFLLEDLQWCDENSLQLLNWLNQQTSGQPILLLASYRQDEDLHLAQRLPLMQTLHLERLSADAIARLSAAILGADGRQTHLLEFLERQSEGNAFFVVEVMRSLAQEAGSLDQVSQMDLPEQVRAGGILQLVQRRLGRIPAWDRPLLDLAAVAGRRLDLLLLRHLAPDSDLEQWLTDCVNAAVLELVDGGLRWQFNHDKLREGILAELQQEQRILLHLQLGQAIEQVYTGELSPHYADLAWHFGQAGVVDKERSYLRSAAQTAQASYANSAAISYYQRLLTLSEPPSEQMEIRWQMATLRKRMGEWDESEQVSQQGLVLAEEAGDSVMAGRFAQIIGSLHTSRGNYPQALEWLLRARTLLNEAAALSSLCEALNDLGVAYHNMGEYAQAKEVLNQSLTLAGEQQLKETYATAIQVLGRVHYEQGEYEASYRYFQQALERLEQLGAKAQVASTMNNLANLVRFRGEHARARTLYEAALTNFREIGEKVGISAALNNLGITAQEERDFERSLRYLEQSLQLKLELNDKKGIALVTLNMAGIYAEMGMFARARDLFLEGLAHYRQLNNRLGIGISLYNLGEIAARMKEYAAAYPYYHEALALLRQVGDKQMLAYAIIGVASLLLLDQADAKRTTVLLAAANRILTDHQLEPQTDVRNLYQQTLEAATAQLDPTVFQSAWQVGQGLTLEQAIDEAVS
ncbi:MAG: tetratricopeptide repeat protein [Caldilineaceae bacterium]